jgi:hypothetical protein
VAVDLDGSGGRVIQIGNEPQESTFSAAALSDDCDEVTGLNLQVDIFQNLMIPEGFFRLFDYQRVSVFHYFALSVL